MEYRLSQDCASVASQRDRLFPPDHKGQWRNSLAFEKSEIGSADDLPMNVHNVSEIKCCSKKFEVAHEEWFGAVTAVGPLVADFQRQVRR